jgi:tetratricopeptide (TPR) repeat protein
VEDHPEPLVELRRLLSVHEAYRLAGSADELVGQGRHDEAADLYRQASQLAPDNHELRLWAGLGAAQAGNMELALTQVRAAIAAHPPWRDLLERLPEQVAPSARMVLAALEGDPG